jgi:hypothetical protein
MQKTGDSPAYLTSLSLRQYYLDQVSALFLKEGHGYILSPCYGAPLMCVKGSKRRG